MMIQSIDIDSHTGHVYIDNGYHTSAVQWVVGVVLEWFNGSDSRTRMVQWVVIVILVRFNGSDRGGLQIEKALCGLFNLAKAVCYW